MRKIKLTPEQARELEIHWREIHSLPKIIAEIIKQVGEEYTKRETDFWEQVKNIAGCKEDETVRILWIEKAVEACTQEEMVEIERKNHNVSFDSKEG